jgi:hypothetical protein
MWPDDSTGESMDEDQRELELRKEFIALKNIVPLYSSSSISR